MDINYFNKNIGESVSLSRFAEIIGVDRAAVTAAVKRKRLSKSIIFKFGKKKIHVLSGCIEWHLKKDYSMDRTIPDTEYIKESKSRREYYRSLQAKLEYERQIGLLVEVDEVAQAGAEICLKARQYLENSRDRDCYQIPKIFTDFEARQFLKKRDDRFLNQISALTSVTQSISEASTAFQPEEDMDDED